MEGVEGHPTLSRAERKLILFDIYKIDWFVIETHFTKTVPSKPTSCTHLDGVFGLYRSQDQR